jgi:hypothetical protein
MTARARAAVLLLAARPRAAVLLLAVGATLMASGCATPEGNPVLYHDEAVSTLEAARSEVQTVRIALVTRLRDRNLGRATDDVVSTAESSLSSIAGTFEGLQPPRGADAVRQRTGDLLSAAQDAVAAARIAVRRDDRAEMQQALDAVTASADHLDKAADTLP